MYKNERLQSHKLHSKGDYKRNALNIRTSNMYQFYSVLTKQSAETWKSTSLADT